MYRPKANKTSSVFTVAGRHLEKFGVVISRPAKVTISTLHRRPSSFPMVIGSVSDVFGSGALSTGIAVSATVFVVERLC